MSCVLRLYACVTIIRIHGLEEENYLLRLFAYVLPIFTYVPSGGKTENPTKRAGCEETQLKSDLYANNKIVSFMYIA